MTQRLRIFLWLLLPANLVLRLVLAFRPLEFIDGFAIPDDAYLALTLARNIANGLGPLYSLDFTNGFQPLYVFLAAPLYWIFPNNTIPPIHTALALLAVFDTLSLLIVVYLIRLFSKSEITPALAGLAWVLNPYIMLTTANGLETTIAFFFMAFAYYFYHRLRLFEPSEATPARFLAFGVLLGISVLARIDNAFFAVVMVAALAWSYSRAGLHGKIIAGNLTIIAVGAILTYLPWLVYSYRYTGDIIPISGGAVRYLSLSSVGHQPTIGNWFLHVIKWSAGTIVKYNALYIAISIISLGAIILAGRKGTMGEIRARLAPHLPILVYGAILFLAYTFYIFTVWYFKRYFFPIALIFILISSAFVELLNVRLGQGRGLKLANAAITALIVASCVLHPLVRTLYFSKDTAAMGYMNLGKWADRNYAPGTVVGSCQTGALGYFARDLSVVNLDGVVNKACFRALTEKRAINYMKETGIEYFIDWEANRDFIIRESRNFKNDDLIFESKIEAFTSWRHEWLVYRVNREK